MHIRSCLCPLLLVLVCVSGRVSHFEEPAEEVQVFSGRGGRWLSRQGHAEQLSVPESARSWVNLDKILASQASEKGEEVPPTQWHQLPSLVERPGPGAQEGESQWGAGVGHVAQEAALGSLEVAGQSRFA